MFTSKIVVFMVLATTSLCEEIRIFPSTMLFGVATASYQIEGGRNVSDIGQTNWDTYVRDHGVADNQTADVACDSYHQWRRDIDMLTELGVDFYRFSLSWSRLLPSGFDNHISEDGKNYYNNLINGLLEKGIEPMVTIYHWDLPQPLQDLGGWANPLIADWFTDYARVVFDLFGDRVKTWITINEPISICDLSYDTGMVAPGIVSPDNVGTYLCTKNVLVAHAKAWRLYDQEYRAKYNGEISYCNNLIWYEEKMAEDADLAELVRQHNAGRYSHPVFSKEGGWPPTLEKHIAEKSLKQGYHDSRLPAFTEQEIRLVKGTFDFYGMNYYTSRLVVAADPATVSGFPLSGSQELGAAFIMDPSWKVACNNWIGVHPEGIRKKLVWLKQQYGDIKILITENGYPTCQGDDLDLKDQDRVDYYREYLKEVQQAMISDNVNIGAYTAWSLMDNFEWMDGYRSKFGLYAVNFTDPQRTRTARKSAKYIADTINNRMNFTQKSTKLHNETYVSYVYYFVGLLIVFVIFVCVVVLLYKRRERRRKADEINEENLTPLTLVNGAKI